MKNRKAIGYNDSRVILSDILPYEVPPFFNNRNFYDFITRYKIKLDGNKLKVKKHISQNIVAQIVLIFGLDPKKSSFIKTKAGENYDYFVIPKDEYKTIPFEFKISHKDNDFRKLSLIHPLSQLEVVNFYRDYNSLILYHTSLSKFSLRKPHKISTLKIFRNTTKTNKNNSEAFIELNTKEYKSLKTYFTYEKYSNIYKYYESYDFQKLEKKFNFLTKFDISRCFDSIYTHSITWATHNKKFVKDNLNRNEKSFGEAFDNLMQKNNYNETNGIVIGPEFSRIFAEIILQKIDQNVEKILEKSNYLISIDYEIARYVDDYFIFYNDVVVKELIISHYKHELQTYNLHFNDSKTLNYSKPIITEISIAKEEIKILLNNSAMFKFSDSKPEGIKHYLAKDVITNYKSLLSRTNTSYKDLQNYFLASIFRNLKSLFKEISKDQKTLIKEYKNLKTNNSSETQEIIAILRVELTRKHKSLIKKILEIIELSYFVYTVLPRVSYCIKLCQILITIIDFIKNSERTVINLRNLNYTIPNPNNLLSFDFDTKHDIFKRIYDGIYLILNKKVLNEYSEIETLYLLPIIDRLGKEYELSAELIEKHFLIDKERHCNNYFTITFLMTFIKGRKKYEKIISILQDKITKKLEDFDRKNTEQLLLLIEVLTNPYFGKDTHDIEMFRDNIINSHARYLLSNETGALINIFKKNILNSKNLCFFDWKNTNLAKELNTKRGHEVY